MDGEPADVLVDQLALAGMDARTHLDLKVAEPIADRLGSADRACRAIEHGQGSVAQRLHHPAPLFGHPLSHHPVVTLEQLAPCAVPQLRGALGRTDDVGEEDRRQSALRARRADRAGQKTLDLAHRFLEIAHPEHVVAAGKDL